MKLKMKMKKLNLSENKKKIIVLSCMVVLLIIGGTLNVVLNVKLANDKELPGTVSTFYTEQRTDRQNRRNEQIALLDAIINSESSSETAVANAEKQKLDICATIEKELVLESMIKAKGFSDVIVTMQTDKLNVFVDCVELTDDELAQIFGVIESQTDYLVTDVVIIPSKAIV